MDVRADGALLWPRCSRDQSLDGEAARTFLFDHAAPMDKGAVQVSQLVELYGTRSQVPVNVTIVKPELWGSEVEMQEARRETWAEGLAEYAGWALVPSTLSGLYDSGLLQPLEHLLPLLPGLSSYWQDIPRVFRDAAAVYDGNVVSLPYTAEVPLLFWRKDLFAQKGLSPPDSWEEALQLAGRLNGTQLPCLDNASASCEQHGFCFGLPDGCLYDGIALTTIWASMVGSYGTKKGLYFDPVDMKPLFTGPAMAEAIRIYRELYALSQPVTPPPHCLRPSDMYFMSRCMLALSVTSYIKSAAFVHALGDKVAVSPVPGSHWVQNRATGRLERCTAELCPYGKAINSAVHNGTAIISRVPYMGRGALSLAINRRAAPNHALAALRAFTFALTHKDGWPFVLAPYTRISPVRSRHLSSAPVDLERWEAEGYDPSAIRSFLAAVSESMAHPAMAMALRIPGAIRLEVALGEVATRAVPLNGTPATTAALLSFLENSHTAVLRDYYSGRPDGLRAAYWRDLNYQRPLEVQVAQRPPRRLSTRGQVGVAVGAAAALLAVAAAAAVAAHGRRCGRGQRAGLQPVAAPGYGPDTSLFITDIQSSTALWEELPPSVMDMSLSLHNGCVRGLLAKYSGYECHTEGDSFVCAFPSAVTAVACALELQVALMQLPWPQELLRHAEAEAVYVTSMYDNGMVVNAVAHSTTAPVSNVAGSRRDGDVLASPQRQASLERPRSLPLSSVRLPYQPLRQPPSHQVPLLEWVLSGRLSYAPLLGPHSRRGGATGGAQSPSSNDGQLPPPSPSTNSEPGTVPSPLVPPSCSGSSAWRPEAAAGSAVWPSLPGPPVSPLLHDGDGEEAGASTAPAATLTAAALVKSLSHAAAAAVSTELLALHKLAKRQAGIALLPSRPRTSSMPCNMPFDPQLSPTVGEAAPPPREAGRVLQSPLRPSVTSAAASAAASRRNVRVGLLHALGVSMRSRGYEPNAGRASPQSSDRGAAVEVEASEAETEARVSVGGGGGGGRGSGGGGGGGGARGISFALLETSDSTRYSNAGGGGGGDVAAAAAAAVCISGAFARAVWSSRCDFSAALVSSTLPADASDPGDELQDRSLQGDEDEDEDGLVMALLGPCGGGGGGGGGRVCSSSAAALAAVVVPPDVSRSRGEPLSRRVSPRGGGLTAPLSGELGMALRPRDDAPTAVMIRGRQVATPPADTTASPPGCTIASGAELPTKPYTRAGGPHARERGGGPPTRPVSALRPLRSAFAGFGDDCGGVDGGGIRGCDGPGDGPDQRAAAGKGPLAPPPPSVQAPNPTCHSFNRLRQPSSPPPHYPSTVQSPVTTSSRLSSPKSACPPAAATPPPPPVAVTGNTAARVKQPQPPRASAAATLTAAGRGEPVRAPSGPAILLTKTATSGRGFSRLGAMASALSAAPPASPSTAAPHLVWGSDSVDAAYGARGTAGPLPRAQSVGQRSPPRRSLPASESLCGKEALWEATLTPPRSAGSVGVPLASPCGAPPWVCYQGNAASGTAPRGGCQAGGGLPSVGDSQPPLSSDGRATASRSRSGSRIRGCSPDRQARPNTDPNAALAFPNADPDLDPYDSYPASSLDAAPLQMLPAADSANGCSSLAAESAVASKPMAAEAEVAAEAAAPMPFAADLRTDPSFLRRGAPSLAWQGTPRQRLKAEPRHKGEGPAHNGAADRPPSASTQVGLTIGAEGGLSAATRSGVASSPVPIGMPSWITASRRSVSGFLEALRRGPSAAKRSDAQLALAQYGSDGGGGAVAGAPSAAGHGHGGGGVLCFRGFRVRVGICSGLIPGRDVVYCKDLSRRTAYSGACMQLTKLVSDAAVGGMVLLGASTVERLLPLPKKEAPGLIVWHKGRFELETKEGELKRRRPNGQLPPLLSPGSAAAIGPSSDSPACPDLYQAMCGGCLVARQLLLDRLSLRTRGLVMPGVLAAPLGCVTLCAVAVAGVDMLMAWDERVTREALDLLYSTALAQLRAAGGFPAELEAEGGRLLAAFEAAPAAVHWLLLLEDHCRNCLPWPPELLQHEMGDELLVTLTAPPLPPPGPQRLQVPPTSPPLPPAPLPQHRQPAPRPPPQPPIGSSAASSSKSFKSPGGGGDRGDGAAGKAVGAHGGGIGGGSSPPGGLPIWWASPAAAADGTGGRSCGAAATGGAGSVSAGIGTVPPDRRRLSLGGMTPSSSHGCSAATPVLRPPRPTLSPYGGRHGEAEQAVAGSSDGAAGFSAAAGLLGARTSGSECGAGRAPPAGATRQESPAVAAPAPNDAPGTCATVAALAGPVTHGSGERVWKGGARPAALPSELVAAASPSEPQLGVTRGSYGGPRRGATLAAQPATRPQAAAGTGDGEGSGRSSGGGVGGRLGGSRDGNAEDVATLPGGPSAPVVVSLVRPDNLVAAAAAIPDAALSGSGSTPRSLSPWPDELVTVPERHDGDGLPPSSMALLPPTPPPPLRNSSASLRLTRLRSDSGSGADIGYSCPAPTAASPAIAAHLAVEVAPPLPPPPQSVALRSLSSTQPLCEQPALPPSGVEGGAPGAVGGRLSDSSPSPGTSRPSVAMMTRTAFQDSASPRNAWGPQRAPRAEPASAAVAVTAAPVAAAVVPPPLTLMQQRLLRGLRLRLAAEEGSFSPDGSVSAARLYRGQHGGRPHTRLMRLCGAAPVGQVVVSAAVVKGLHRAATAGDPTARRIRTTPLAARAVGTAEGRGAAAASEGACGGGEAEVLAAVAATVASKGWSTAGPEAEAEDREWGEECVRARASAARLPQAGSGPPSAAGPGKADMWVAVWVAGE